jgi:hypothetical protein
MHQVEIHDSSVTRVAPVFDRLYERDPSGRLWLQPLLELPERGPIAPRTNFPDLEPLREARWGGNEISLPVPPALLQWLAVHVEAPHNQPTLGPSGPRTFQRRPALLANDASVQAEALALLHYGAGAELWSVLEHDSRPDIYLETDSLIVVIEGKRDDRGPTTYTTWMKARHQMLRYLDAAWERRAGKCVVGFFIVEGVGEEGVLTNAWQRAPAATVNATALAESLPHRGPEDRAAIAQCFIGITTWQAVCWRLAHLGLDWASLPDTVAAVSAANGADRGSLREGGSDAGVVGGIEFRRARSA